MSSAPVTRKAVTDVANLDAASQQLVAALAAEADLALTASFESGPTLGTGTFGRYEGGEAGCFSFAEPAPLLLPAGLVARWSVGSSFPRQGHAL